MIGTFVRRVVSMARSFVQRSKLGRRHYMFKRMPTQNLPLAFTHRRYLFLVCFTVTFFLCLGTTVRRVRSRHLHEHHHHHSHPHHELSPTNPPTLTPRQSFLPPHQPLNSTLSFSQIFVLNLPSRPDKRDSLTLAASLSNLTLSFRPGISGSTMTQKAIPPTYFNHFYSAELTTPGMIGSWRGHMNILREIVEKGLETALILEDDIDWDIGIKEQLSQFGEGAKRLLGKLNDEMEESSNNTEESIYGNTSKWDLQWLGHCGGWAPTSSKLKFQQIITNDPTVPPSSETESLTQGLSQNDLTTPCSAHSCLAPNQRIIQISPSPKCSFAYAVTQSGARKLLYHLGGSNLENVDGNFDTELTEFCRGDRDSSSVEGWGRGKVRCLSVSPPYFVHWRERGWSGRDSELGVGRKGRWREKGGSRGVRWSVRGNAGELVRGREVVGREEDEEEVG